MSVWNLKYSLDSVNAVQWIREGNLFVSVSYLMNSYLTNFKQCLALVCSMYCALTHTTVFYSNFPAFPQLSSASQRSPRKPSETDGVIFPGWMHFLTLDHSLIPQQFRAVKQVMRANCLWMTVIIRIIIIIIILIIIIIIIFFKPS